MNRVVCRDSVTTEISIYLKKLVKKMNMTVTIKRTIAIPPIIKSLQNPSSFDIFSNSRRDFISLSVPLMFLSCFFAMESITWTVILCYLIVPSQLFLIAPSIALHFPHQTQQVFLKCLLYILIGESSRSFGGCW